MMRIIKGELAYIFSRYPIYARVAFYALETLVKTQLLVSPTGSHNVVVRIDGILLKLAANHTLLTL